jgi:DNA-binding GntR family transcriptional regulator
MHPHTLKQHTYEIIRNKLLSGALKPGSRLSDDLLARELGISRSPVREAISQLASEGLVDYRPRNGAYVKRLDRCTLEQLYETREPLERYAARRAAAGITPERVAQLRQLCTAMRGIVRECRSLPAQTATAELVQRFLALDLTFHEVILDAAGNGRLKKLVTDFKILTQTFGFVPIEHDLRVLRSTYRDHRRVLQAIERRDGRAAGAAMGRHIRSAKRLLLAGYDRRLASGTA